MVPYMSLLFDPFVNALDTFDAAAPMADEIWHSILQTVTQSLVSDEGGR